jgi:hypothetical protein
MLKGVNQHGAATVTDVPVHVSQNFAPTLPKIVVIDLEHQRLANAAWKFGQSQVSTFAKLQMTLSKKFPQQSFKPQIYILHAQGEVLGLVILVVSPGHCPFPLFFHRIWFVYPTLICLRLGPCLKVLYPTHIVAICAARVDCWLLKAQVLWFSSLLNPLITTFGSSLTLHGSCSSLGSIHNTACALVRLGVGVMVLATCHLLDLPEDLQRLILRKVPLRESAQVACLGTRLRTVYLDRVKERDAAVAGLLESHFTAEFREGLSSAEIALPRDLIVDPQVRGCPFLFLAQVHGYGAGVVI